MKSSRRIGIVSALSALFFAAILSPGEEWVSQTIKIEAESGQLNNCAVQKNYYGADVVLPQPTGWVTFQFQGSSGKYDINIRFMDEWDGVSSASLRIGGKDIGSWKFDKTVGDPHAADDSRREPNRWQTQEFRGVQIEKGAAIELKLQKKGGENARVDYISFAPVAAAEGATMPPAAAKSQGATKEQPATRSVIRAASGKAYHEMVYNDGKPIPTPTAEENDRGFILFSMKPYLNDILPASKPLDSERNKAMTIFACPGEYELATFAVYPLHPLSGVKIETAGLTGPGGKKIASDCVDIRAVRPLAIAAGEADFKWLPCLLDRLYKPLEFDFTQWVFVTVHVPKEQPAGKYQGKVTVSADGKSGSIDLGVDVLPFPLEPSRKMFGMLYTADFIWVSRLEGGERAQAVKNGFKLVAGAAAHGMTTMAPHGIWRYPRELANGDPNIPELLYALEAMKKYGMPGPCIYFISPLIHTQKEARGHGTWRDWGWDGTAFANKELYLERMRKIVRYIQGVCAEKDYPEVVYEALDEPDLPERIDLTVLLYSELKKMPKVRTALTCNSESIKKPAPYVDFRLYGNVDARILDIKTSDVKGSKGTGVKVMIYAGAPFPGGDLNSQASQRNIFGIYQWQTELDGVVSWTDGYFGYVPQHCFASGPMPDFMLAEVDKQTAFTGGFQMYDLAKSRDIEPQEAVEWEAVREGIDDYRYIETLQKHVAEKKKTARSAVVIKAEEYLAKLKAGAASADNGKADTVRSEVKDLILALTGQHGLERIRGAEQP